MASIDERPRLEQRVAWVVLGLLCLLCVQALLTRRESISDDAWISMRYSRNLVEGHGLLWNPGQPPVEGYSNLLWVMLGAVGVALNLPMTVWLKGLGLGMSVAVVPLAYAIVRELGGSAPWGLLAAALTAVSSQIGGTALFGLEPPSLTLLMTLGTWAALREERRIRQGSEAAPWSSLAFGLLAIAHVEGPIYLAIPVLIRLTRALHPDLDGRRLDRRDALSLVLLLSFPVGQELLRIFYYGDWVPNTIRVKAMGSGGRASAALGVRYVLISLTQNPALLVLSGLGLVGLGLGAPRASREQRLLGLALLLPWLCCAAFSIAARGDMINRFRFMAPSFPTFMAATALGWAWLVARTPAVLSLAIVTVPLGLGLGAMNRELSIQMVMHNRQASVDLGTGALRGLIQELSQPLGRVQTMPRHLSRLWRGELQRPIDSVPWFVAWVLENVPPGDTVMFPDVGLLGYALTQGGVLDARGLNSRGPMLLLASDPPEGPEGMQDPGVLAFLEEFQRVSPCCLVLQASNGRVWGPPEAALQGSGLLNAYRGVATGRYSSGDARVYTLDRPAPSREVVLARYRAMVHALPTEYDWASRLAALERGDAPPAEAGLDTSDVQLYPVGAWYESATFPPR